MPSFLAADYAAGAVAAIGNLAALRRRDRIGRGCRLDLSMHDCLFAMGNISLAGGLGVAPAAAAVQALRCGAPTADVAYILQRHFGLTLAQA